MRSRNGNTIIDRRKYTQRPKRRILNIKLYKENRIQKIKNQLRYDYRKVKGEGHGAKKPGTVGDVGPVDV